MPFVVALVSLFILSCYLRFFSVSLSLYTRSANEIHSLNLRESLNNNLRQCCFVQRCANETGEVLPAAVVPATTGGEVLRTRDSPRGIGSESVQRAVAVQSTGGQENNTLRIMFSLRVQVVRSSELCMSSTFCKPRNHTLLCPRERKLCRVHVDNR